MLGEFYLCPEFLFIRKSTINFINNERSLSSEVRQPADERGRWLAGLNGFQIIPEA